MNDDPRTLEEVARHCWSLLAHGATHAGEPFRTPVLGTVGHGTSRLRTVVLRQVTTAQRTLICHTDGRSAKIDELRDTPEATWLFYDAPRKTQLRLSGPTFVHIDDDIAHECWQGSSASSRRCYSVTPGPGTRLDQAGSGLPPDLEGRVSSLEASEGWFEHFAAIRTRVTTMEWLWLSAQGHRRARFSYDSEADAREPTAAEWLVP